MSRIFVPALIVFLVAAATVGGWYYLKSDDAPHRHASLDTMEEEGVPQFSLPTPDGKNLALSDIEADLYLINFWASWCAPCVEEFPSMMELAAKFGGRLKILAISEDSNEDDMLAFLKAFDVEGQENLVVLWDKDKKVATDYTVDRLPESFLVDSSGKLIRKVAGTLNWMEPSVVSYVESLIAPQ